MSDLPLHIQEGVASAWERKFAWFPVRLEEGGRAWLQPVFRRYFYPPTWFVGPAPYRWRQYSLIPASFWELRAALAEQTGFNEPTPHKPQYPFEIKSSAAEKEKT